jgi:hypothetical protein
MHADRLSDPNILAHYEALAREDPRKAPMRRLVTRLRAKAYADDIPASTSHDALVVAWDNSDTLAIDYDPGRLAFQVEFRTVDSRVTREYCDLNGAESLFDSFVLRLSLADRTRH